MAHFVRSAIVPTDPSPTVAPLVVPEEDIAQYFQAAILTLLVYDAVTTMDKEVKYFWILPLKPVTTVYFANRYIGFLGAISSLFIDMFKANLPLCKFAIWSRSVSYWATIVLIDYILMIRVLALYSRHKTLSIYLASLLILAAAFKLGILIYITLIQSISVYSLAKGVVVCGENRSAAIGWGIADWFIPMAYGVILMTLALYKATLYWRMSAGLHGSNLVKILIHDQIIYFFLVVSCCVLNILQFKLKVTNAILAGVLATLGCPSLLCVLGSRMLFNLKAAGDQEFNEQMNYRAKSVTKMEFITLENI